MMVVIMMLSLNDAKLQMQRLAASAMHEISLVQVRYPKMIELGEI